MELERDWSESWPMRQFIEKWAEIQNSRNAAAMYDRLIRKICREVDQLLDLVSPDSAPDAEIEGATVCVSSASLLAKWIDMRDHTHKLHCKLSHIWSYNCPVQQHQSKIRIALPIEEGHQEDPSFYYSFLLHGDALNGQWRSVKIVSR